MLSSDETKAGGKPRQRKAKPAQDRDKRKPRKPKAAAPVPEVNQAQHAPEEISEAAVTAETTAPAVVTEIAAPLTETAPPLTPVEASPAVPAVSQEGTPVSYRTIVDVWGTYSRTSLEQTQSYLEKLAGVRSLGGAFEVQSEFAKQACEAFVAQWLRIGELQSELTKQRLKRLEGFMAKMTPVTRS